MSDRRPTIEPALLASLIEASPGRVRRRFDKEPAVAHGWSWKSLTTGCEIQAGTETVRIEAADGTIRTIDQVRCSCLLSPNCFHILACLGILDTAAAPAGNANDYEMETPPAEAGKQETSPPARPMTSDMARAAHRVREAVAGMLRVGARASGALVQSGLLRAGHDCRAAGLPMLGNTTLRIAEGVRRVREQSDITDSAQLRQDLFTALHATEMLARMENPPAWIIGTSRRQYGDVPVSRLDGWFAEPILTRSGYAGICIHLLAGDGQLYQLTETRPGDSQLVRQAYRGGIDLGTLSIPGSDLCRRRLVVQNAVASDDGRLGKGTTTRWAVQGENSGFAGMAESRFSRTPAEQLESVFRGASDPLQRRRGGWDLVAVEGELLGARGPAILVRVAGQARPWRLRIAIDDPELAFRENLQLLARCPGLRFRGIGRVRIEAAGELDLLAIGPLQEEQDDASPRLRLPDEWQNLCNLGLDRLERHHVDGISRWGVEIALDQQEGSPVDDDGLAPLDRRLTATALGGYRALPRSDSPAHRRDTAALLHRHQSTAASLVEALGQTGSNMAFTVAAAGTERQRMAMDFETAWLACATYFQAARLAFHHRCWSQS